MNTQTYEQWMEDVDHEVMDITESIGVHDLADFMSYDAWADGMSPREAAIEALQRDDLGAMYLEAIQGDL